MLTEIRAKEVMKKASQWPHWGNYSKFMTEDEIAHIQYYWDNAKSGSVSFGSLVSRVGNDLPMPELKEGFLPYEDVHFSNEG